MSLLERILAQKRVEVVGGLAPGGAPCPRAVRRGVDVVAALSRGREDPLRLVAEVKFRSPSAGPLSRKLGAGERAVAYAASGARMVSVLCDSVFFGGGFGDLAEARRALDAAGHRSVPLLAKDFVVDPVQLEWAAQHGADAVLLIARIVDREQLGSLGLRARALRLEPFVEVVTEEERETALAAGAEVLGVNARDLNTLEMDAARAARVLAGIPRDRVAIHLSGLGSREVVAAVAAGRADAALVGEALMREDDPTLRLREFVSAASGRYDAPL
jgi:indole-3-glycerol phosphate synthase